MKKILPILIVGSLLVGCQSNLKIANKDQGNTIEQPDNTIIQVQETHDGSYTLKNENADSKGLNVILEVSGDKGTISIISEEETKTYSVQITEKFIVNEDGTKDNYEWTETGIIIYEEEVLEFVKQ